MTETVFSWCPPQTDLPCFTLLNWCSLFYFLANVLVCFVGFYFFKSFLGLQHLTAFSVWQRIWCWKAVCWKVICKFQKDSNVFMFPFSGYRALFLPHRQKKISPKVCHLSKGEVVFLLFWEVLVIQVSELKQPCLIGAAIMCVWGCTGLGWIEGISFVVACMVPCFRCCV